MILGIMSDTHGQQRRAAAAIAILRQAGAGRLVHCGDIGSASVLDELAAAGAPASFVWGNCDSADMVSAAYVAALGLQTTSLPPLQLSLANRRIAVFHGHERAFVNLWRGGPTLAGERGPEIVLYGHSHVADDETRGGIRFINPGALHRAARFSVATLDLSSDRLDYLAVP